MLQPRQAELLTALANRISARDITQQEVALATGIHQSQISRILSGDFRRASKNVIRLCKYAETLPALREGSEMKREAVLSDLVALLGQSPVEDAALQQVIASLRNWRQAWGTRS